MPTPTATSVKDTLPGTAIEWVAWLHAKFGAQKDDLPTARALFQLILLGCVKTKDVFGEDRVAGKAPLRLLDCAQKLYFEFASIPATPVEQRLYKSCMLLLVQKGFRLEQLLPEELNLKQDPWLAPFVDDTAGLLSDISTHVCWNMATKFRVARNLTAKQRHVFLVLWLFWCASNSNFIDEWFVNLFLDDARLPRQWRDVKL